MKCDRCGLQSDVEQAFSTEKSLLHKPRHFCPDCAAKRDAQLYILSIAGLVALGLLVFAVRSFSWEAVLILVGTLAVFLMIPLVIIHELAHAAVAKLVGARAFGITIGVGKTIWSGKLLGIDWVINVLPIAGITRVGARPVPHVRWKLFSIYLAGPASHIMMALGFAALRLVLPFSTLGQRLFSALVLANILLAAVSLFPQKTSTLLGMQGTDGWHLLHVPFLNESEITKYYIGYFAGEAMQSYIEHDFDRAKKWVDQALTINSNSAVARNILGIIQLACREYHASRQTFLQLLGTEEAKEPGLHYILLNNIAYLDALLQDPSLLPEADQFSAEALKHLPWVPAVMGTRGTVLLELGQLDEGLASLKKSMSLHPDKHGKALNACHVAIGELRRGDREMARKYLASAKMLDPNCTLIADVESQMAKSRDNSVTSRKPPEITS